MQKAEFIQIYKSNPCRFHASAIWKTLERKDLKIEGLSDKNGVSRIKVYNESNMFLHWDRESNQPCDIKEYQLALLHKTQVEKITEYQDKYFRLLYDKKSCVDYETNYIIKNVDIKHEARQVAKFISSCYQNINQTESNVLSWTKHSVYDKKLWIWVIDENTSEHMGLGIAEYDKEIKEGSLEWIQVHPKHNGKGVGKVIVYELIKLLKKADFITVSGRLDNKAAERLYRSCGFTGDDIWCVIRNKTK